MRTPWRNSQVACSVHYPNAKDGERGTATTYVSHSFPGAAGRVLWSGPCTGGWHNEPTRKARLASNRVRIQNTPNALGRNAGDRALDGKQRTPVLQSQLQHSPG